LEVGRRTARAGLRSNRIARSREFASILHSESRLQTVLRHVEGDMAAVHSAR
jgi:hypothetical protein